MFGSLTLSAQQSPNFSVACLGEIKQGEHCSGRYSGKYELGVEDANYAEVSIPSRDKHTDIWAMGSTGALSVFADKLATLDSNCVALTWRQKLADVQRTLDPAHAFVLDTTSTHSTFALVAGDIEMHLVGVHDPVLKTSHLVWSTQPVDRLLRQQYPLRLLYYRFPVISNSVVFIPTQIVCAHWWRYCKHSELLFAFNALEAKLFREIS